MGPRCACACAIGQIGTRPGRGMILQLDYKFGQEILATCDIVRMANSGSAMCHACFLTFIATIVKFVMNFKT